MIENDIKMMKDKAKAIKYEFLQKCKISNIEDLIGNEIKPKTLYTIVTQKKITRHAFTEWIIKNYGVIDEMYISTYRMGIKAAKLISKQIKDGNIKKVHMVLSQNYNMLLGQKASEIENIIKQTKHMSFSTAYNHSKITIIKTCKNFITISGSGNYSENDHIEDYTIVNDKDLYDFHKRWINGTSEKV